MCYHQFRTRTVFFFCSFLLLGLQLCVGAVYVGVCVPVLSPPTLELAESAEMELASPLAH